MSSVALATAADLPPLRRLLHDCAAHLGAQGYRNWLGFDVAASLARDMAEREVWLLREEERLVGTWTVGTTPMRDYPPGFWPEDGRRALYLNRLAVAPAAQQRGLGARCMAVAEAQAREHGIDAIRLDYLSANPALRRFYGRLGYVPVGEVPRGEWVFTACEKRLDGTHPPA